MCACILRGDMGRYRYGLSPHTHTNTHKHTHTHTNRPCCVVAGWPRKQSKEAMFWSHGPRKRIHPVKVPVSKKLDPAVWPFELLQRGQANEELHLGAKYSLIVLHNKYTVTHFLFFLRISELESPPGWRGSQEGVRKTQARRSLSI